MRLHDKQWGSGDRIALLLHGMMGSAESWWRLAPELVVRGYRVIALDLPGHGHSAPNPSATVPVCAGDVAETVSALGVAAPEIAIGHSFGGAVLAAAVPRLQPGRVIYVDAPFTSKGGWDPAVVRPEYAADRAARTYEQLRRDRPSWSERDWEVEATAAERFDVDTATAIAASPGGDWTPTTPPASLVIRAYPSDYVSDESVNRLRAGGVDVRQIAGAAHSVWYSHFDEFLTTFDDWIDSGPAVR
jgi:pimeloyl-ACP methyl ester carboxylesterase